VSTFFIRKSYLYCLVRGWTVAWLFVVPWIHIHPAANHHHGAAQQHIHDGIVHSVFSPDLDEESDGHHLATDRIEHDDLIHRAISNHPSQVFEHAEFGFSFLHDSTDRNLVKPLFTHVFIVEPAALRALTPKPEVAQIFSLSLALTVRTRDIPSRAPPFLLL
jgi:hypothetical protein